MKLEEAIVDLLLRHNCVVVPAFGGFIAQSTGAVIDRQTGVMSPPRKSVLFNRQLINNDGLLISHLSTEGGMNYAEAEKLLTEHVVDWHARLQEGKRVSIDKIGHLFLDAERNISFEQDRFFNLLLQSYGLNKVHFITEEEVKIAEYQHRPEKLHVPLPVQEESKIDFSPREITVAPKIPRPEAKVIALEKDTPPKRNRVWKYAVAAALLPFAFYTYWIPMQTNVLESGMISWKDFNPTYRSGEGVYQQKTFAAPFTKEEREKTLEELVKPIQGDVYSYKYDDDMFIPVKIRDEKVKEPVSSDNKPATITEKEVPMVENLVPEEVKTKNSEKQTTAEKGTSGPQYIVGAYSSRENAESMVELLKSKGLSSARIADTKGGLVRVSAGGSDNVIEMDAIVEKADAAGFKGWILK
jgi:hypothetical protein